MSLIIHLTDLSNGGQFNGRGQLTGGKKSTGVSCLGVNCPGDNCHSGQLSKG